MKRVEIQRLVRKYIRRWAPVFGLSDDWTYRIEVADPKSWREEVGYDSVATINADFAMRVAHVQIADNVAWVEAPWEAPHCLEFTVVHELSHTLTNPLADFIEVFEHIIRNSISKDAMSTLESCYIDARESITDRVACLVMRYVRREPDGTVRSPSRNAHFSKVQRGHDDHADRGRADGSDGSRPRQIEEGD